MKVRLVAAVVCLLALAAAGASAQPSAQPVESESAVNRRGYELIRKGDVQGAIRVFQQNVEAHPESANVYDSLGEAYVEAGDTARAVENYRRALAINPRSKSARYALERLTGERHPLRPLVLFHIAAGVLALLSGAAALSLRKGSRRHRIAGNVFAFAIACMATTATYIASTDPNGAVINVLMGILTTYLVATGWLAARRQGGTGLIDDIALVAVVGVTFGLVRYGFDAASRENPTDGIPAAVYFVFAIVTLLAAVGDLRMISRGGVIGGQRIARHLWRMCTALLIAVGSFFLGQPQVFPDALRRSAGLRAIPVLLVLALLVFWLVRVKLTGRYGGTSGVPTRGSSRSSRPQSGLRDDSSQDESPHASGHHRAVDGEASVP